MKARQALAILAAGAGMVFAAACMSKVLVTAPPRPAVVATVHWDVNTEAGIGGVLDQSMSTAFQSAIWQSSFFDLHPDEREPGTSALVALGAKRPLVQIFDSVDPFGQFDWNFSELDAIVRPLIALGEDPILQINKPGDWSTPQYKVNDLAAQRFADYCAGLARYYGPSQAGVVLPDGGVARANLPRPIRSWAIWTDPNTNDFDLDARTGYYGDFYSACAARIRAEDPDAVLLGAELNDCHDNATGRPPSLTCQPGHFIPTFLSTVADAGRDGGMAPIDVLSLHMFPTDVAVAPDAGTLEPDQVAFTIVGDFARDVTDVRAWLVEAGRPDAAIWVTESQVNSDVPTPDALSQNLEGQSQTAVPYQADLRGTSAFFAAWRPYLFSQLGQHGNQALFQWQYTAGRCPYADANCSVDDASDTDRQNAEVDYSSIGRSPSKFLSYYVDQALASYFPPGGLILQGKVAPPDPSYANVEVLATRRIQDGHDVVVVMAVDWAVENSDKVNGDGLGRNVVIDLTSLFGDTHTTAAAWNGSLLVIDRGAMTRAPVAGSASLEQGFVPIQFGGYGVAFLKLTRR